MSQPIDIRSDHLQIVQDILNAHIPNHTVWVFGSRAKWTTKDYSDLDLCVKGSESLSFTTLERLRDDFSESNLPYKVDIVDWYDISRSFREIVERDKVLLPRWEEKSIADLAEIIGGGTPKTNNSEYWDGDIQWLSIGDFNNDERWVYNTEKRITQKGFNESSAKILQRGQLIISARGTVGALAQLGKDMAFNQSCYGLNARQNMATNDYLYYAIKNAIENIKRNTHGAIFDTITKSTFEHIKIPVPSIPEQNEISTVLGALDKKIELNRQINKTLEATARALFKSWFVDFDPVRAKMEGRQPEGLSADLAALFTDIFADSRLGPIPKGWSIDTLKNVTSELKRGISPAYIFEGGVKVLNQRCIKNRIINNMLARRHDVSKKSVIGREIEIGDILVNSTGVGTLGRVAQVYELEEQTIVDSHITVVRANKKCLNYYYLGWNLLDRESEIECLGEGSTGQTELSRERLGLLNILIPPQKIQVAFQQFIEATCARISFNNRQNIFLSSLRDALLPKLISGALRVSQ